MSQKNLKFHKLPNSTHCLFINILPPPPCLTSTTTLPPTKSSTGGRGRRGAYPKPSNPSLFLQHHIYPNNCLCHISHLSPLLHSH